LPLSEEVLGDTDTMMVFGLDHMITEQEASAEEIEAVRKFLTREGTCLLIGPHHDVGVSSDPEERLIFTTAILWFPGSNASASTHAR